MSSTDFLAENRITVTGPFAALHLTPATDNCNNNGDMFRVTFNTGDNGGQNMFIGQREVEFVTFVVVGPQELRALVDQLSEAYDRLIDNDFGGR